MARTGRRYRYSVGGGTGVQSQARFQHHQWSGGDYCGYGAAFGCAAEDRAGIMADDAGGLWQAAQVERPKIKVLKLAA